MKRYLVCLPVLFFQITFAQERTFTDDQGRQIEAELAGMRGENVVLKKNGRLAQWPASKLSKGDQAYASLWKKGNRSSPKIQVRIWEREGIGENGVINGNRLEPTLGKNIPFLKQTEEKGYFRHYDVDLHNNSAIDASNLVLSYVLYVISPSRQVIAETHSEQVSFVGAGKRQTVKTKGVTFVRSKTTSTTFGTNVLGNLQIGSDTNRSKETFGGAWVRIFSANGELAGEAKDLIPSLEKVNPQWVGEQQSPTLPTADSFEQLKNMLAPLKKIIENLPERPKGFPKPPGGKGKGGASPFPPPP